MLDKQFNEILHGYLPFLGTDEELCPDTNLRDLGLDSLATVELMASLEAAYDGRFIEDDLNLETFTSPGVLWAAVERMRTLA
ncbi:phosphopantetheine-binding protein [Kitasatospora sp. NPDC086801]|uniref:phosphopantetheine-binding protein n=1 Tax=Kitasatospora sp. NPDC086801 TaxID=3364066 RepID=UPI00381736FA